MVGGLCGGELHTHGGIVKGKLFVAGPIVGVISSSQTRLLAADFDRGRSKDGGEVGHPRLAQSED